MALTTDQIIQIKCSGLYSDANKSVWVQLAQEPSLDSSTAKLGELGTGQILFVDDDAGSAASHAASE